MSSRRSASPAVAVALALATVTGATSASAAAKDQASTCVPNVSKVIATKPTEGSTTAALPATLVAKLDKGAVVGMQAAATPGAVVGVRTPRGTWVKAYGNADPANKTPMKPGVHTRIGSVTKTFTGTLLLQLQEKHKLSLDDTIDKYVSGVPNGNRITLRQLANMTSGVASYTKNAQFEQRLGFAPETVYTPEELVAYGVSESPAFEPGAQFDYSNTNTVLLGLVIEKVTGKRIGDVLEQRILKPLKLKNTVWPGDSPAMPTPYAQGFTLQGATATPDNPSNATDWNPSWGWTAGELISNVDDLLTYDRALGTGQGLLGSKGQAQRLKSFPPKGGYGLALGCIDGWVGHSGELPGYNTTVFYDTKNDTSVVVQTNSDISSGNCPVSPTLTDDPRTSVCSSPADAIFVPVSKALGHPFTPNPVT